MQIDTRPVGPGDAALLRTLFDERMADHPLVLSLPPEASAPMIDMQYRAQQASYDAIPGAVHEIVEADGVAIGQWRVARRCDHVLIVDLTIAAAHRGRGIGGALLAGVQHEASGHGMPVRLSVSSDNSRARSLYERLAFEVLGDDGAYVSMEWRAGS